MKNFLFTSAINANLKTATAHCQQQQKEPKFAALNHRDGHQIGK